MKFVVQTGRSIADAFAEFDKLNPHVYKRFKDLLRILVNKGAKKASAKAIINYLRWEMYFTTESQDQFKINDAFTAHYSRKFQAEHPEYAYLFDTRDLRSN